MKDFANMEGTSTSRCIIDREIKRYLPISDFFSKGRAMEEGALPIHPSSSLHRLDPKILKMLIVTET